MDTFRWDWRHLNRTDLDALLLMRKNDSTVQAATDRKWDVLDITNMAFRPVGRKDAAHSITFQRVMKYWLTFVQRVEENFTALAICPLIWADVVVSGRGDSERERKYSKQAPSDVVWRVPRVPEWSAITVMMALDPDGNRVFKAGYSSDYTLALNEPPPANPSVHVLVSCYRSGPDYQTKLFHSKLGALLPQYRDLLEMEATTKTVAKSLGQPMTWLETAQIKDPGTADLERRNAFEVDADPGTYHADQEFATEVTVVNNVSFIPAGYKMATQPRSAEAPPDMHAIRLQFVERVSTVLGVPLTYMAAQRNASISGQQNVSSGKNDEMMFNQSIKTLRNDLIAAIKTAWALDNGDEEIEVDIPILDVPTLEEAIMLWTADVVEDQTFRELAAQATGISPDLVKKGKVTPKLAPEAADPAVRPPKKS